VQRWSKRQWNESKDRARCSQATEARLSALVARWLKDVREHVDRLAREGFCLQSYWFFVCCQRFFRKNAGFRGLFDQWHKRRFGMAPRLSMTVRAISPFLVVREEC
jgi:hypothetical protein